MPKLYYIPPSEEIFNEVKAKCIEIWRGYDDTYGYATEKIDEIKDLQNIQDNVMFIVAQFDHINMEKLANLLSDEARTALRERMMSGGNSPEYIPF